MTVPEGTLVELVRGRPGLTWRELLWDLQKRGWPSLTKSELNRRLYAVPGLYWEAGADNQRRWFFRETTNSGTEPVASQVPETEAKTEAKTGSTSGSAWPAWRERVLEIVGVSQKDFMRGVELQRPWLLVPREEELAGQEAENLFSAVRERLLHGGRGQPSVTHASASIEDMNPLDSLPLLYAMRHVARYHGSTHRYWPVFQAKVLGGELPVEGVQQRLAQPIGRSWAALYEHTGGALYYPRVGHKIIKWPLAHAGLLNSDKGMLTAFVAALSRDTGDQGESLIPADLAQFLSLLRRWLSMEGDSQASCQLARMLQREDGTEQTMAELAQRWMLDNAERILEAPGASQAQAPGTGTRRPQCRLRYEPDAGRVCVVVPEQEWNGDKQVRLLWGDGDTPARVRYLGSRQKTISDEFELPLETPQWSVDANLTDGVEERQMKIPGMPEHEALVFLGNRGGRLLDVRTEEELYLILPSSWLQPERADRAFSYWTRMPLPEGWVGYEAVRAQVRNPLAGSVERPPLVAAREFEEDARALGLPGVSRLLKARAKLVGGAPAGNEVDVEAFAASEPPLLQLEGMWQREFSLELSRLDEWGNSRSVSGMSLLHEESGTQLLVELWPPGESPEQGRYRVAAGPSQHLEFELVAGERREPWRLAIQPRVEVRENEISQEALTRRELERGSLALWAWPAAQLTLELKCGSWDRTLPIFVDASGEWRARLRDLGVGQAPPGRLQISVAWQGLLRETLEFADAPFAPEEDLRVALVPGKEVLLVSGKLSNPGANEAVRAVLVGEFPWQGAVEVLVAPLEADGSFTSTFRTLREPAWLLLLSATSGSGNSSGHPWAVKRLRDMRPEARYPVENLQTHRTSGWKKIAEEIRDAALPPDLQRLLDLSSLAEYLRDAPRVPSDMQGRVVQSPKELRRLQDWAARGLEVSVAVLSDRAEHSVGEYGALEPPFLSVAGDLEETSEEGVGLVCVSAEGTERRIRAVLRNSADAADKVELQGEETFHACPECGMVLPPREFEHHVPPVEGTGCAINKRRLRQLLPGKREPARLLASWEAETMEKIILNLVSRLGLDDDEAVPEHAERWVEDLQGVYDAEEEDREPRDWLLELVQLPGKVRSVRTKRFEREEELARLGRRVYRYRDALKVLDGWIQDENGARS